MFRPGLVSVMMPAYNAGQFIAESIQSVLDQSFQDWELLIVNDGSTDDTAAVVSQFRDPRIRVFNKENGGESSARNVALDHSQGEFIAYLDADDVYLPQHLAVTVAYLRADSQRDAVYTDGFHIDEHGQRMVSLQARRRGPFEGRIYEEVVRASDVFGPPMCVVLRHELVARHRLRYDTRIVIGPDWDFFIRFADLARFGYLPEQTGLYRVHRTNISTQVNSARRAGYLAICRENAIKMPSFNSCSAATRVDVFYDLLINLLRGYADRREQAIGWSEFAALPVSEQGRLLRLTAASAILHDADRTPVAGWLRRATTLNPGDRRAGVLRYAYALSPRLCAALLRVLTPFRGETVNTAPFADLTRAAGVAS